MFAAVLNLVELDAGSVAFAPRCIAFVYLYRVLSPRVVVVAVSRSRTRRYPELLTAHLARMVLFKINTGCREQKVCRLSWDWEVEVPELDATVFLIPSDHVKNGEERLIVLNAVAKSVIDGERDKHGTFVFTHKGKPVTRMYNSAWRRARAAAGLPQLRVHDLKHTFGRRLRAAGVSLETRKVLLGHTNGDITSHYSAPELEELFQAVSKVCGTDSRNHSATA